MRGAFLAAMAAAAALAGCLGPEEAPQDPPLVVAPGAFYLVVHPGGPLRVEAGEATALRVWGPDDAALGLLRTPGAALGPPTGAGGPQELSRAPAGDLVVQVVQGSSFHLDPRPARWVRLGMGLERHVLADPGQALPLPGLGFGWQSSVEVTLKREPVSLRLLSSGGHEALALDLGGPDGTALEASGDLPGPAPGSPGALREVPATEHPEAFAAVLRGNVSAARLDGALVLEATSYSRAVPPQVESWVPTGPARFAYGSVAKAGAFEAVAGSALHLAGPSGTTVAIHDEGDRRIAVFALDGPVAFQAPSGGTYVAAVIAGGPVELGSDRAPGDLAVQVLPVRTEALPGRLLQPGYSQGRFEATGTVFAVEAQRGAPFGASVGPCAQDGLLQVERSGEAAGTSLGGLDQSTWDEATLRLDGSPVSLVYDGFGDLCEHPYLLMHAYER